VRNGTIVSAWKGDGFFNGARKKAGGNSLETQDHRAFELFAPELIHESRNCSKLYGSRESGSI